MLKVMETHFENFYPPGFLCSSVWALTALIHLTTWRGGGVHPTFRHFQVVTMPRSPRLCIACMWLFLLMFKWSTQKSEYGFTSWALGCADFITAAVAGVLLRTVGLIFNIFAFRENKAINLLNWRLASHPEP